MSWLIVFISTLFPLVLLAILMTLNWPHREHGSRPAPLKPENVKIQGHRVVFILITAMLLVMNGCATPYVLAAKAATSHENPRAWTKDQLLKEEMRKAILADQALSGLSIAPYVYMRRGFVVGFVHDAEQAAAVTRAAQKVSGLRSLETYLPIKDEPPKESSSSTLSDLELVAQIKVALKVDEHLIESRYGIEVLDGHAVLLGVVTSEDEKHAVERAAKGVKGVTDTKDFLLPVEQGYEKRLSVHL